MRDGVTLYTVIRSPAHSTTPLPFMIERTPYGTELPAKLSDAEQKLLAGDGYIQINQDIRGKFKSGGEFVMLRPPHDPKDPTGVDECTDTYDTIEWLIHHVPGNNGKAGITGVSYDGWLAAMALIHPHPALKAASPQAPVADMFLGDDFHHNGAFRLSYGFEYVWLLESGKELNTAWPIDKPNAYDWYLENSPLSTLDAKFLHGKYPSWNDFVAHPNDDAFWQRQAIAPYLKTPLTVPTLLVGGWYDQEDFYGPQRIHKELAKHDPSHLAYMVLGPWNHGGWGGPGKQLGPLDFGSATGDDYRHNIEKPWFDHWLKGTGAGEFPHVQTFETGANKWIRGENWPPRDSKSTNLYLGEAASASFDRPAGEGFDSYVSDPAHPAPYRASAIKPTYGDGSTWYTWLTDDQRELGKRPDVLTWQSKTLESEMTLSGDVLADLFASTTGTDSDWVVKLLDVSPDGTESIISDEVFRGRFRTSFEHPQALIPNKVEEFKIDLHAADHVFLKGHRIGVQIQSAWFPLIDRNPQTFVPNIFAAKASDYQKATQRIYRSRRYPTHLVLPLRPTGGGAHQG